MRPSTMAEACAALEAGEDFELALGDFLRVYHIAPCLLAEAAASSA